MKKILSALALALNLTIFAAPTPAGRQTIEVASAEPMYLNYQQSFLTWVTENNSHIPDLNNFIDVLNTFHPHLNSRSTVQEQYKNWKGTLSSANQSLVASYEKAVLNPSMPNNHMSSADMYTFMTRIVRRGNTNVRNEMNWIREEPMFGGALTTGKTVIYPLSHKDISTEQTTISNFTGSNAP